MSRHWLPAVLVLGAALAASTACGSQNPPAATPPATTTTAAASAATLVSDIKSASQNASAVHIKGTVTGSGSGSGKISVDLQLNKDGSASGQLQESGQDLHIISVKGVVYVAFTASLMKGNGIDLNSAAGKLLLNKWVASTSKMLAGTDMVSGVKPLLDYSTFIGGMTQQIPAGTPKAGKADVVNGTPVQLYTFSDGSMADVATASPHYLTRLIPAAADGAGQVDFTNWNQPVAVSPPPASQIYSGPGA